ncbi:uncharacterized protein FTOL_13358 [Fusarium torulosum]|uniref:F-box domain-containing protein n=1 Tax=Fusarium torulosum TaxID=33205 RepID=A0AAE8MLY5_9HYPO|nr:uncharacterized protein FTOL_13358 [Fusarium torulosum]
MLSLWAGVASDLTLAFCLCRLCRLLRLFAVDGCQYREPVATGPWASKCTS